MRINITSLIAAVALVAASASSASAAVIFFNNQDIPIPGVTLRIEGNTRQEVTDETGQFLITEARTSTLAFVEFLSDDGVKFMLKWRGRTSELIVVRMPNQ